MSSKMKIANIKINTSDIPNDMRKVKHLNGSSVLKFFRSWKKHIPTGSKYCCVKNCECVNKTDEHGDFKLGGHVVWNNTLVYIIPMCSYCNNNHNKEMELLSNRVIILIGTLNDIQKRIDKQNIINNNKKTGLSNNLNVINKGNRLDIKSSLINTNKQSELSNNLNSMSYRELQQLAKKYNIKANGKLEDLRERILYIQKNKVI